RYELGFWTAFADERGNSERDYATLLTEATGIRYDPRGYLSDMDSGFYSADYLRAWIRSAQLRAFLLGEVGPDWWRSEQTGDLLRDVLVLLRQLRVRLEQRHELVGLSLRRLFEGGVTLVDHLAVQLVPVGLARLREQDQRCGVRRLGREDEVQHDPGPRIPVVDPADRVQDDPGDDDERLADDVLRRAEEARELLGTSAELVATDRTVRHNARLDEAPDAPTRRHARPRASGRGIPARESRR